MFGGRNTTVGAFISLLMFPTITTMLISGLWHGAGYGFIVWGVLHGIYLSINHGWRLVAARLWRNKAAYHRLMRPAGLALTFLAVTGTMVLFRAFTMTSAIDLVRGLIGMNGFSLHGVTQHSIGVFADWPRHNFIAMAFWIGVPMFVALACPNTMQILARYEPALGVRPATARSWTERLVVWNAAFSWAIVVSAAAALAIFFMGPSEFLYWRF